VALSTVKLHCGKVVAPAGTGKKPESTPVVGVVICVHGAANVDWVTVWFLDWNWKAIVSPTFADTVSGLKVRAVSTNENGESLSRHSGDRSESSDDG